MNIFIIASEDEMSDFKFLNILYNAHNTQVKKYITLPVQITDIKQNNFCYQNLFKFLSNKL